MRKYYIFVALLSALSIGLVIAAILLTGTPAKQRALQLDETRISDFSMLSSEINNYHLNHDKLPQSLEEVKEEANYIRTTDPESKTSYTYKATSDKTYELCATFSTDSKDDPRRTEDGLSYPHGFTRQHKKGYDCLKYTISSFHKGIDQPAPMPAVKTPPETLTN